MNVQMTNMQQHQCGLKSQRIVSRNLLNLCHEGRTGGQKESNLMQGVSNKVAGEYSSCMRMFPVYFHRIEM